MRERSIFSRATFRRATQEDFPALWRLENSAHSHPWAEEILCSMLHGSTHRVWVMELPGQGIVSFAVLQIVADEASLLNMASSPAHQGKGLGRDLLDRVIDVLTQENRVQNLFLEVRAGNARALRLYESCGFVETGVRKKYYPLANGKREDAVMMALPLIDSLPWQGEG